jgi:hypothetical protein
LSGIRTHDPGNQPAKTHASDRTATVTGMLQFIQHYHREVKRTGQKTLLSIPDYVTVIKIDLPSSKQVIEKSFKLQWTAFKTKFF